MKVLLIVDVIKDFCRGGSFAVPRADEIVPIINELMNKGGYDLIIAANDSHERESKSFASNHVGKKPFDVVIYNNLLQTVWVDHAVRGTPGAEFHADLDAAKIHKVVLKGTDREVDSLSAFRDNARNKYTELRGFLEGEAQRRGEKLSDITLDVTGLALEYCCKLSAEDSRELGIQTRFVVDATRAVEQDPNAVQKILFDMRIKGIEIVESRSLLPFERALRAEVPATSRSQERWIGGTP